MKSRERVYRTLAFELPAGERIPRQLWVLPWADLHHPGTCAAISQQYPADIAHCPVSLKFPRKNRTTGGATDIGLYTDEWGCVFENCQAGIIGEVKSPIVEDWANTSKVIFPEDALTFDVDAVNAFCKQSDCFVLAGACPRPFERLQFIRGTENLYMDLALDDPDLLAFIRQLHAFYLKELEAWSQTDVDALFMMDDWGTQNSLLISPDMWRRIFKPLYRDYIELAHAAGKKIFMHSDGYILDIYPDLIEMGLDAINSQIFCMGLDRLASYKGQITFWGELDRQHILPTGTEQQVRAAVKEIHEKLACNGGVIAQCEFGPGAKPENVITMFAAWDQITAQGSDTVRQCRA